MGKKHKEQDGSAVLWHGHVCSLSTALYCGMAVCDLGAAAKSSLWSRAAAHTHMRVALEAWGLSRCAMVRI